MIARPVAAQFAENGLVALFELALQDDAIRIRNEAHYQLVPAADISEEELLQYRVSRVL